MDYANVAKKILEKIGGESNVNSVQHCMTRLRFTLKDESKADDEAIKKIKGVMGVTKQGGQYQVIIGNNVGACYKEILKLGNFKEGNSNEVKDIFPNKKGESAAVLFINKEVRRNINSGNLKKEDNDTVVMSNSEFDEFIIEVRRTHGHGFTKTLRDVSEQVFINIIRNFMKDFSMIREEKDFTILMPIIGKVLGEYPEDYKGEAKDEG